MMNSKVFYNILPDASMLLLSMQLVSKLPSVNLFLLPLNLQILGARDQFDEKSDFFDRLEKITIELSQYSIVVLGSFLFFSTSHDQDVHFNKGTRVSC